MDMHVRHVVDHVRTALGLRASASRKTLCEPQGELPRKSGCTEWNDAA